MFCHSVLCLENRATFDSSVYLHNQCPTHICSICLVVELIINKLIINTEVGLMSSIIISLNGKNISCLFYFHIYV